MLSNLDFNVLRRPPIKMKIRQSAYFSLMALRGQKLGKYYRSFLDEYQNGIPPDTTKRLLIKILAHCQRSVPYYAAIMDGSDSSFYEDPFCFLRGFPFLTKGIIRDQFDRLKSRDLPQRKWYLRESSGSTGEPALFVQDRDHAILSGAITLLFSRLVGREIGEYQVSLWGSARDVIAVKESWAARFMGRLANQVILDALRMSPERMRKYIEFLNNKRPRLILAYANAIYELARFAESERMSVAPQNAIISSAMTLYPPMREVIERVFHCRVYDRYGSRELGDVACERPGSVGLWVAPWGSYVEIVDDRGHPVPDGQEGEIVVTSLTNYAMPLVRYRINDRGFLLPNDQCGEDISGQTLGRIAGRTTDSFRTKDGTIIHSVYFMIFLAPRQWIRKFQVIQPEYSRVVYRIVRSGSEINAAELDEIRAKTRRVMGLDCQVDFEFVDEIAESESGKFRHFISEVSS